MECVEHIEDLLFEDNLTYSVEITNNGCRITRSWTTTELKDLQWHQTGDKFLSTTNAICEFILTVL